MALPLDGVRIVSLGVSISGPVGLRHLADFGAEVLKVEVPETGDMVRLWDDAVFGEGAVHFWVNPNKKSVTLNLKDERGKKILREMLESADVFLENFSPGAIDRLGFGYEEVKKIKPDIIYVHTSGYGQDGPYRDMKAFDGLIQAEAGIMEMTGPPESPAKMAHSICDGVTGLFVALGAMMALRQRDQTGEGQELDVSMFDCMVSMQGYFHFHYFLHGAKPSRVGVGHHFLAPYGAYPAKGGKLIGVACGNENTWRLFAGVLGHPEWVDDPRFATNADRHENKDALLEQVLPILATKEREEWRKIFLEAGVPCGAVNDLGEVCDHPQTAHREIFPEVEGEYGNLKMCRFPVKFSEMTPRLEHPPGLSAHTEEVLEKLGYSPDDVADLRRDGVI